MKKRRTKRASYKQVCTVLAILALSANSSNLCALNETLSEVSVNQQAQVEVKGKVLDKNQEPLIGVAVIVKGTTIGSVTNLNGEYAVKATPGQILEFNYLGYLPQVVTIKEKTTIDVILIENSKALDEVVVVGYGSMKKTEVATAISQIKPEEFNLGGASNRDVRSLLEGRVAGLTVTRTGGSSPTDGVSIQLRGISSVNGSKEPLIIIDGIPGGNLNLLRPDDIESIDVLKDGSAAAIYGSRANAGVIIITTKKGAIGKTAIEYSTYVSRYYKSRKPKFLNATEYKDILSAAGKDPKSYDLGGDTDMYDEIINKNNLSWTQALTLTGGSESTMYRVSLFYNNLEGVAEQNERKQWGGRLSLTNKALDNMLTVQTNMSTTFDNMNMLGNDGWEAVLRSNPTMPIYKADGSYYENMASDENKVARLHQQKNKREENTLGLDSKITLTPIKDLNLSVMGSVIRNTYDDNIYYDKDSRTSINDHRSGGYAQKKHYVETKGAIEPTIDYSYILKDKHKFSALAGYSWQMKTWNSFEASNSGFLNDATQENDLGAGTDLGKGKAKMGSNKEEETLISFFGRVNYIFDEKYIFQASIRREGSTKFGKNNKWGNFPSISLAWNMNREAFIEKIPTISSLKLRVGYGVTGNSGIDPYQSVPTIGTGNQYPNDGVWGQTYGPSRNPNPDLKWETKREWNLGIDFGVLNNRITGAIDLYKRKTKDLLMQGVKVPIPSNTHSSITKNLGEINSSGLEITLNAIPISTKDINWNVGLVLTKTLTNKFENFSDNLADYYSTGKIGDIGALGDAVRYYDGYSIGTFYGKRFAGFDESGEWLFYNKKGEAVLGKDIDQSDWTKIGNGAPKWNLGFNNTVQYKNFDLTIGFIGKFKFDILNRQKMLYGNMSSLNSGYNVLKSAITDGVNTSLQYSDYYLEKGDYLKLDNLTIGYTLKNTIPYVNSARFYFTARDLFYITSYDGQTPEVNDTGLAPGMDEYGRSPSTRSFTVGCNISF